MSTNKRVTNDMLKNLYLIPSRDKGPNAPHYPQFKPGFYHQADILYLPEDNGYKYALVVVDCGTKIVDARPLKTKEPKDVLKAFKSIYKGKYLKPPSNVIGLDNGTEFKGVVREYFENTLKIHIKFAKPDRHKQQAIVENKNKQIGKLLFMRMTAEELQTGNVSKQWVDYLPSVIDIINEKIKNKNKKLVKKKENLKFQCSGDACDLIPQGTMVRVALDVPRNVYDMKKLHGRFRATDIRWDPKPRIVMGTLVQPGNPPLYLLDDGKGGTDYQVAYTKNQLQIIPKNEQKPKESDILPIKEDDVEKWHVEKILGRKKLKVVGITK